MTSVATAETMQQPAPIAVLRPLPYGLERIRAIPSVLVAMVDQALVSGANFIAVVALAHAISMDEFGRFSLSFSVLLFVSSLVYAVIILPISVFLPERTPGEIHRYLARLELIHRSMIPIVFLVALPAAAIESWPLVLATAAATAMRLGVEFHRRVAYAMQDSVRALLIDLAAYGLIAVAAFALLLLPVALPAWKAIALMAFTSALGWTIGLWVNRGAMSLKNPEPLVLVARQHWQFGKWNLGGTLAMWGASQLYPFLVAGYLGLRDVAVLAGSIRIMGISNVINQGIEAFATPRLRRHMVNEDIPAYHSALGRVFTVGALLMLPLCLIVILEPDTVMRLCLGESFAHGAFTLQIIAVTQFFAFLTRIATIGLNSLKQPKPGFWGQLVCAIATLAAGPWIVSNYGLTGACVALLVNATVIFSIMSSSFFRIMPRSRAAAP